jgi:hypothetical protein
MCDLCRQPFSRDAMIVVIPYTQMMCHVVCALLRWQERFGRN